MSWRAARSDLTISPAGSQQEVLARLVAREKIKDTLETAPGIKAWPAVGLWSVRVKSPRGVIV